jgi:hypothetical protein
MRGRSCRGPRLPSASGLLRRVCSLVKMPSSSDAISLLPIERFAPPPKPAT